MKITEAKLKALIMEEFSSIAAARCFAQFSPAAGGFLVPNLHARLTGGKHGINRKFMTFLDDIIDDQSFKKEIADYFMTLGKREKIMLFEALLVEHVALILFDRAKGTDVTEEDYLERHRTEAPERVLRMSEEIEYAEDERPHWELMQKCLQDVKYTSARRGYNDTRVWFDDIKDFIDRERDEKARRKELPRNYNPELAAAETAALPMESIKRMIKEELTKTDKAEIKRMISKELDKSLKKELKKALEDELTKALNSKATKEEIGDITKKVLKKLYKDLSFHHPYIIDRIKV